MKKLVVAMMVVLMATMSVCAQKVKRPNTYNYNRGVELVRNEELDEGLKYLEAELEENPKNGYAYSWAAIAYVDKEQYGYAMTAVDKAIQYTPKKDKEYQAVAHGVKARIYEMLGEMDKAIEQLGMCIALQPEDALFYETRAQMYYELEQYGLADKDYEKMIELDKGGVIGYMGIGRNAIAEERYDDAIKQFDYVLKMYSDYSSGYAFRAEAYMKLGEYTKSADDIVASLEIERDNKAFFLLDQMAGSAKMVMEAKLKAKSLKDASNPQWHLYLGVVNESAGDYAHAVEHYKHGMELYPTAYYAYRIYTCYEAMGRYPQALEYIDYAIELDSTDNEDLLMRANLLYYMGRMDECMRTIDRYIENAPDFFGGYYRRGFYKDNTRDVEGAIEDYSMAIALNPDYAYAYLGRADMYMLQGDKAAAEADYRKVVEIDTVPDVGACAMYAYLGLGQRDKAKEFMQLVLDTNPDDKGVYYDAACLYARMGENGQSVAYLRQSFEKGYHNFVHIDNDDDLDVVREMEEFKVLIEEYKEKCQWDVETTAKTFEEVTVEVPFTKDGDMCMVKCSINNLPLHFIFDTGASIISMSDVEASFMMKNGYLSRKDVVGMQHFMNADGSVSEGTILNLRNVDFGGVTLDNVQASVVKNQRAPLLLGQSVLQKLGRIEIDNEHRVLKVSYKRVVEE